MVAAFDLHRLHRQVKGVGSFPNILGEPLSPSKVYGVYRGTFSTGFGDNGLRGEEGIFRYIWFSFCPPQPPSGYNFGCCKRKTACCPSIFCRLLPPTFSYQTGRTAMTTSFQMNTKPQSKIKSCQLFQGGNT